MKTSDLIEVRVHKAALSVLRSIMDSLNSQLRTSLPLKDSLHTVRQYTNRIKDAL
jgi:hypothetical protein